MFTRGTRAWYLSARHRAQRRKSPWNLLLFPLAAAGWFGSWYGLFRLVWAFHAAFYPQHSIGDFWREGIGFRSFVASRLMVFALAPGSLCLGLLGANCVAWLIRPARRALDAEALGYERAGFRDAMFLLLRFAGWTLVPGLILALVGATILTTLK